LIYSLSILIFINKSIKKHVTQSFFCSNQIDLSDRSSNKRISLALINAHIFQKKTKNDHS
jgi:hypothetical protein